MHIFINYFAGYVYYALQRSSVFSTGSSSILWYKYQQSDLCMVFIHMHLLGYEEVTSKQQIRMQITIPVSIGVFNFTLMLTHGTLSCQLPTDNTKIFSTFSGCLWLS